MDLPVRRDTGEAIGEVLDRRLVLMLLGGILCLGMALGLELFPHLSARDIRMARLAPSEGRVVEPLILPEAPASRTPINFGELMQILSARRGDLAARRFVQEFLANPALKRVYEQASPQAGRPASEFIATLQRSVDFGELVRSHSKDPAFRLMAENLTRHPDVNRLLRGLSPLGAVAPQAGPRPAPSGRGADTFGAEERGRSSPVGDIKAPGKPLQGNERR